MKIVFFGAQTRFPALEAALQPYPDIAFLRVVDNTALPAALHQAEVLITSNRIYTPDHAVPIREHGRALRWIQFTTSGIDKAIASGLPSGLTVTNAAGLRAFAVAEHAFALMLGLLRNVRVTERARMDESWARDAVTPSMDNLSGKHLVLVGLGAIAQEIARKAKAFDMRVTGISRSTAPMANIDRIRPRSELREAAADADILLLAVSYDATTEKIVNREIIGALRPQAYLVNIARGGLIDEPALVEALAEKKLRGAGLDVTVTEPLQAGHPFWAMPNVLLTPHVAGAGSSDDGTAFVKIFMKNLRRWRAGEPLNNVVIERTP